MNAENKNDRDTERLRKLLKDALPPMGGTLSSRDFWPRMLRRIDQPPSRVPWFDWALLGFAAAASLLFPALIPALLYHL